MDNLRLILFVALGFVVLMIYQAWMQEYGPVPPAEVQSDAPSTPTQPPGAVPGVPDAEIAPELAAPDIPMPTAPLTQQDTSILEDADVAGLALIEVETDLYRLEISPRGGEISSMWLKDYAVSPDDPDRHFRLLKPQTPNLFVAQSGLKGTKAVPSHEATYTARESRYVMSPDDDELVVSLDWNGPDGLVATKRYRFERGSYTIHLETDVSNTSDSMVAVRAYNQLKRSEYSDPNEARFIHTYTGGVYYSPEDKYQKVSFKEITKRRLEVETTDGWIAMIQHYFLAAWIPPTGAPHTFFTSERNGTRYIIGQYSEPVAIPPGGQHSFEYRLFAGPKLQNRLAEVAPGLELTVDYGWLTVLAKPIFWLLDLIHKWVGNWGWAIILLTILIKAAFYWLSESGYKSMAKMRNVAPRLQALKDKFGDDKQRLNEEMMKMYKKEQINPLGGCLPILVQIPVFIALYWVLLESVELRQASFMFWLDNLSAPDPYFVLPLIMGVSMFVQQKLNPPPPDPIQAKVLMALPFVFTIFFAFFPSGLVLYWVVNNLLSIAQQWFITQKIEKAAAAKSKH